MQMRIRLTDDKMMPTDNDETIWTDIHSWVRIWICAIQEGEL